MLAAKPLAVYSLPGTSHVLVNERSLDSSRQAALVNTVLDNVQQTAIQSELEAFPATNTEVVDESLRSSPHVFVVDTDSVPFIVDTGANRFIINDASLFVKGTFKMVQGSVKGVGGTPVALCGTGTFRLPLVSDDGSTDRISVIDAVYVPSSPYNLVPPQLLIALLKKQGYQVENSQHDEKSYQFFYQPPGGGEKKVLTVPLNDRGMFSFATKPGFLAFMARACGFEPKWKCFAGAAHVIDPDSDDEDQNELSRESATELPREPAREPTRESPREPPPSEPPDASEADISRASIPTSIPHDDSDFEPLSSVPVETSFSTPPVSVDYLKDAGIAATERKRHRLSVFHERFGHLSFSILRMLARAGIIPSELKDVDPPICPGCAYGKAHRKPWRGKGKKNRRRIKPATAPGQVVSVDQLVSPTPGFVPTQRGIPTTKRYTGATVFVDHFSDFTYVHLMMGQMDAESTVEAKLAFERVCHAYGVQVKHYHADNGLFDTKLFKSSIVKAQQTLSFCGVNAHHQNGRAENRIKDVTQGARTSLLHAAHRWPKAISPALWPSALKHYVNLRNALPSTFIPGAKQGRKKLADRYEGSPISKMSNTEVEPNLKHFHPFGSPVYVLEKSLQSQQSHNKWSDRSRVGIFLCHSPHHSSTVPLVLNTRSGNVSPQFHCIYDDAFDTCKRDSKFESDWQYKAKLQSRPFANIPVIDILPTVPIPMNTASPNLPNAAVPSPRFVTPWNPIDSPTAHDSHDSNPSSDNDFDSSNPVNEPATTETPPAVTTPPPPVDEPSPAPYVTRSGRTTRVKKFFDEIHANAAFLWTFSPCTPSESDQPLLQNDYVSEPHPFAFVLEGVVGNVANSSDPDTMTMAEAMNQPDREEFVKAMHKELNDHVQRKHWKVVPRKSMPLYKKALPMVWSMKRKRDPLGDIVKWKARLCAGGHRSLEHIDYWSTYSPVVSWNTVRLMVIFALINDWHMEAIDFVLAFPQAPVKTDIYMQPPKVPPDFTIPDLPNFADRFLCLYKLIKNLYGLKDAGKTWFDFLRTGLEDRGWKQSELDTCLFTKKGIILIVYVDDAILISPDKDLIAAEIKSLQEGYALTDDGPLKDYLGTRFIKHPDGSIEMLQPRMIQRILEILGLNEESSKRHDTPASDYKLLSKDENGEPRQQSWNYRQAVGSLSYLQAMVRPDITMSVQQCARFCNDPKRSHEEAVKRIGRYLLKTRNRGLIFRPDSTRGLECFVDADFAGSWSDESSHDPLSTHSRTGFVIMYAGCPIMWKSTMQNLVSLSSTESEYIALSSALREVIGIMNLLNELKSRNFAFNEAIPVVKCRTFEDNMSCIEIATNHRTRPRTKHLSVRLHHFRSHVVSKTITIEHLSTKEQIADMFTKPLPRPQFQKFCNRLMGWHSPSPARE